MAVDSPSLDWSPMMPATEGLVSYASCEAVMKNHSTGRIHLVDFGRSPRVDADVHVNRMQRPKRYLLRMLLNICIPEPAESCVFLTL